MKKEIIIEAGQDIIKKEAEALNIFAGSLDSSFFDAVELILNCKGKVIVSGIGKSGHIANKITATFSSIGIPSVFLHPAEASHGDMGVIGRGDIVILLSNGGESQEIFDLLDYCNNNNTPLVAVVGHVGSTLYKKSDIQIVIPQLGEGTTIKAPMISTTLMIAAGDALAASLIKYKNITNEDFKKYHPGGKIGATLLKVSEVMKSGKELPIVYEDQIMSDALIEMSNKSLGCTAVLSKGANFLGIITDGDLRRHMSDDFVLKNVCDVMTKNPRYIDSNFLVVDALKLMSDLRITSLFIIDSGDLKGIIHMHDCIRLGLKPVDEE